MVVEANKHNHGTDTLGVNTKHPERKAIKDLRRG